jgi:hypothetical protein
MESATSFPDGIRGGWEVGMEPIFRCYRYFIADGILNAMVLSTLKRVQMQDVVVDINGSNAMSHRDDMNRRDVSI